MYVIAEPELGSKLRLKIFVPKAAVDKAYQKLYQDISDRGSVPGFRPGHVPAWRARRHYGAELCDQAVMSDLLQESLEKAVTYGELNALEAPGFEDEMAATEGQPVEVDSTLIVRPEVHLPALEGIEIEVPDPEPTAEQIDLAIRELQDAATETVEVERKELQKGDLVDVTLKTAVEGEEEAEREDEREESFIVGESRYDPAIDEPLLGHSVGDTVEFPIAYPTKRSMGALAGKTVAMTMAITGLRERQVPDLNDEFAAQAAEVADVAALREKVAAQVRRENEEVAQAVLEARGARWLRERLHVDLPGSFHEEVAAESEDEAEDALGSIKVYLACQEILQAEGGDVSDDEVRAEWVAAGTQAGLKAETLAKEELPKDIISQIRERLIRRRALAIVGQAATRTVVPWPEFMRKSDELSDETSVEPEGTAPASEETEEQPNE